MESMTELGKIFPGEVKQCLLSEGNKSMIIHFYVKFRLDLESEILSASI